MVKSTPLGAGQDNELGKMVVKRNIRPKKVLAKVPVQDLYSEIERRKSIVRKLVRRYERLMEQTNRLKVEIEAHGGFGKDGALIKRPRAQNKISLVTVVQSVLAEKELSVDEITREVLNRG